MVAAENNDSKPDRSIVKLFLGRPPRNQAEERSWTIAAIIFIVVNAIALVASIFIHLL